MAAHLGTEVIARMPNRIGLLADVTDAIGQAGIDIAAISAYERGGEGEFLLVTENDQGAAEALRGMNAEVRETSVVLVDLEDRPRALHDAVQKLAEEGIDVEYAYGTTSDSRNAQVVMRTSDDMRALDLL